jgi:hypothetical protein
MRTRTIEQLTDNQVHKASSALWSHSWESLKFANCTDLLLLRVAASSSRASLFAFLFSLLSLLTLSSGKTLTSKPLETLVHVVTVNILMMNNNHLGSCSTTCTLVTLWNDLLLFCFRFWLQQLKLSWWCRLRIAQGSNPTKSGFRIRRDCW